MVTLYATPLDNDGAEMRRLEPWRAEEFLAHTDRGREFIGQHYALPDVVTDLDRAGRSSRGYADRTAAYTGRLHGIRMDGELVGAVLFRTLDVEQVTAEASCWGWSRRRWARAWRPGPRVFTD